MICNFHSSLFCPTPIHFMIFDSIIERKSSTTPKKNLANNVIQGTIQPHVNEALKRCHHVHNIILLYLWTH